MSAYRAVFEHDEDGYWFVDFPDVPGCHTQARTLTKARQRAHDVLASWVDDVEPEIIEEFTLEGVHRQVVADALERRAAADEAVAGANHATATAVQVLVDNGLTYRDVAALLGISHQRVGQIMARFSEQPPSHKRIGA